MSKKGGSNKTQTATTTSSIPADVLKNYNEVVAKAKEVASQPLQQYQGQLLADFTPQQQAGFDAVQGAQGLYQPYFDQAQGLLSSATGAAPEFDPSQLEQYMSPYNQDVIKATMDLAHQNDAAQQSALTGNAIASGAWGGDRAGVAKAALAGQQQLANNSTIANLNNQNYAQALQQYNAMNTLKQQQNALNLQGAGIAGNLGTSAFQNALTGAAANIEAGNQQQQQAQNALNIPYEQFQQAQQYPFQTTGWLANIVEGIGANSGGTSTTTTPTQQSSGKGGFLGLASGGAVDGDNNYGFGGALTGNVGGLASMIPGGGSPSAGGGGEQSKFSQYVGDAAKIARIAAMFLKDGGRTGYAPGGYVMPESGNYSIVPAPTINFESHSQASAPGLEPSKPEGNTLSSLLGAATTAYGAYKDNPEFGNWFNNSVLDTGSDFLPGMGYTSYDIGEGFLPDFASGGGIIGNLINGEDSEGALKKQGLPDVSKNIVGPNPVSNFTQAHLPSAPQIPGSNSGGGSGFGQFLGDAANIAKIATLFLKDGGAVPNGYAPGGSIGYYNSLPSLQSMRQSIFESHPSLSTGNVTAPTISSPSVSAVDKYTPAYDMSTNALGLGIPASQADNFPLIASTYSNADMRNRIPPMPVNSAMAPNSGMVAEEPEIQPQDEVAQLIKANEPAATGIAPQEITPPSGGLEMPGLDKNQAIMAAGLAMMAGKSPHALQNIGAGGLAGLENWQNQKAAQFNAQEKAAELAQRAEALKQGNISVEKDSIGNPILVDKSKGTLTQLGGTTAEDVGAQSGLSGEEYLKTLPAKQQGMVRAIANGDQPWPTGFALRSPYWIDILDKVHQYDTDANGNRFAAVKAFNTGKQGDQVRFFGNTISHFNTLEKLTDALGNKDVKAINKISNKFKDQFGQTAPSNFDAAKGVVADEVIKALVGAGGALADREEAKATISAAKSPEQLKGVIATYKNLLNGQLHGLEQQYVNSTGRKDFVNRLTPEGRDEYIAQKIGNVPAGALEKLRSDPKLAKDFNEKYGEGAAEAVLGK